jgi:hypothetical protein
VQLKSVIVSCHHPAWGEFQIPFSVQKEFQLPAGQPAFASIPWFGTRNETAHALYDMLRRGRNQGLFHRCKEEIYCLRSNFAVNSMEQWKAKKSGVDRNGILI